MATGTATRPRRAREVPWVVATVLVAFLVGAWSLRLWEWTPTDPFALGWDHTQILSTLRDIHDHGWYWHNPDLGYPFGQDASFFPELNVLHVLVVKAIDLVVPGVYTAGGLYFVLSFPLTGLTGYLLARSQGLGRPAGFVLGVLLANAPGHAERFGHLYLAQYWVVPVALWLVLEVARGRALLSPRSGTVPWWRGARTLLTVAAVVVVGGSGVYYVAFTLVLLAVAALGRRVAGVPADLLRGLGVMAGIVLVIAVPLAAARVGMRSSLVTGRTPAGRNPAESELFAGKLMDLLLPWPDHRLPALHYLTFAYRSATRATVETSALGVVGVAGMTGLAVVGLLALLAGRRPDPEHARWSGLMLVAFLFFTVGGLGSFVAVFATPQVRTWSRLSLYILTLALLAVGAWLTRLERRRGVLTAGVVAGVLVLVGSLDQTNPAVGPDHRAVAREMAGLRAYTTALQARVGAGCGVFQVPVLPYPETLGPYGMEGYDQLKPYLASDDLHFSAAPMRGTAAATWQSAVDPSDLAALAVDLRSAGFCALEVDTQGFAPGQDPTQRLTAAWGEPVARTADGTFVSWDLRTVGAAGAGDARRRAEVLTPVLVSVGGFEPETVGGTYGQYVGPLGGISVANPGDPTRVTVSMRVRGVGDTRREVVVTDGDTELARAAITSASTTPVTFTVDAARGANDLTVRVTGPTEKDISTERVTAAFVSDLGGAGGAGPPGGLAARPDGHRLGPSVTRPAARGWLLPWLALAALAVVRAGLVDERDPYWQVRAGLENLAGAPLSRPDSWSWDPVDRLFTQTSPAWNDALGMAWRTAGFGGFFLLGLLSMLVYTTLVLALARRLGAHPLPALGGVLAVLLLALPMVSPRATLAAESLFLAAVLGADRLRGPAARARAGVLAPGALVAGFAVAAAGSWLHLSWLVLAPALWLSLAVLCLATPALGPVRRAVVLGGAGVGLLAGLAAGPYGTRAWEVTRTVQDAAGGAVLEWMAPTAPGLALRWVPTAALALALAVAGVVHTLRRWPGRAADPRVGLSGALLVLAAPAAAGGLFGIRFVGLALLALAPLAGAGATRVARGVRVAGERPRAGRGLPQPGGAALVGGRSVARRRLADPRPPLAARPARRCATGPAARGRGPRRAPPGCRLVSDPASAGPVLLLRPDVRVWLDTRADYWGAARNREALALLSGDSTAVPAVEGATCALLADSADLPTGGLARALDADPRWVASAGAPGLRVWVRGR